MKTYTATTVESLRAVAARAYLQAGGGERGLEAAWRTIRARVPRLRAPSGVEALARNGSRARSYRSPLGQWLSIPGASYAYGNHAANWPRTRQSRDESRQVRDAVLAWFERESVVVSV